MISDIQDSLYMVLYRSYQYYCPMTTLPFTTNLSDLLLSHVNHKSIHKQPQATLPSYLQVQYLQQQILKINPQEAKQYQLSPQEQHMQEFFQEYQRDRVRHDRYQCGLMNKFFNVRGKRMKKNKYQSDKHDPIEMIKSMSRTKGSFVAKSRPVPIHNTEFGGSMVLSRSQIHAQREEHSDSLKKLMSSAEQLITKKSNIRLRGGTQSDKRKKYQEIMKQQQKDILELIKTRDYRKNQPQRIEEITNKQKYSMGYLEYCRLKTKKEIEKEVYDKRIRKITSRLEMFQQFILREGELKPQQRLKLHHFYAKVRGDMAKSQPVNRNGSKILK